MVDTDKVSEVIEVIRPAIQADAGDIYLRGVDEETGVVSVELVGACVSCPASTVTLKAGIERILKDRVPGVTEVVDVGAPTESAVGIGDGAAAPIRPRPGPPGAGRSSRDIPRSTVPAWLDRPRPARSTRPAPVTARRSPASCRWSSGAATGHGRWAGRSTARAATRTPSASPARPGRASRR